MNFTATFGGHKLDTAVWTTSYPGGVRTNYGNPQEVEWYLPEQCVVEGGDLHLIATEARTPGYAKTGAAKTYPWRSGMVTTFRSFSFTYGTVSVVARLPGGRGTWPAIWLLPEPPLWPPEIDIMENWGTPHSYAAHLHYTTGTMPAAVGQTYTAAADLTKTFHAYGVSWTPSGLVWTFDGQPIYTVTEHVPNVPMYLIINLAIDTATATPEAGFIVDSVTID